MRLRQIKLAGFKSFIDPTPIEVPGSLVGVVGPNGCGKSNVIDAVRWVLGESKAAELRGESMQDVIFNGSVNRKPAGRASVELVFDNADGRIGGAWGQYAEISVKRVLTRDGTSSYMINNQNVRRRDVHDMFLGTGLGPRAYAIIGQGMISRIVEARPEELRIFLEEAAGISKYKERRRETENRLADTRDNLTRVEDILRELDSQIGRLEQQAEVATRYRELQIAHDEQQQLLWLSRRREAESERDKVTRDIEARTTALESHVADLRAAERELEEVRTSHYGASDAVHDAQGGLLQVNAEVARLESEIRMIVEGRNRLATQIETLKANRERRLEERTDLLARAASLLQSIEDATAQLLQAQARCAEHEGGLPGLEDAYQLAREAMTAARADAALSEQAIEAAAVEQRNVDRQLAQLQQRRERLDEERASIGSPDEARLAALHEQVGTLESELAQHSAALERGGGAGRHVDAGTPAALRFEAARAGEPDADRSAPGCAAAGPGERRGRYPARSVAGRPGPGRAAATVPQAECRARLGNGVRGGAARARRRRGGRPPRHGGRPRGQRAARARRVLFDHRCGRPRGRAHARLCAAVGSRTRP